MLMRRVAVIAALAQLLALSGCGGSAPTCNTNGEIIIPADASPADRQQWEAENRELALRRLDQITGGRAASGNTPDSVKKAISCP